MQKTFGMTCILRIYRKTFCDLENFMISFMYMEFKYVYFCDVDSRKMHVINIHSTTPLASKDLLQYNRPTPLVSKDL